MEKSKEYDLVMLPTNDKKVFEGQLVFGAGNHLFTSRQSDDIGTLVAQHLYVVSDEIIQVGDYFLIDVRNDIYENDGNPFYELKYCTSIFNSWIGVDQCEDVGFNPIWSKKIIVSTNKELGLPNIFTTFVKEYAEKFNNKNVIKVVTIETEIITEMVTEWFQEAPHTKKYKTEQIAICQGYVNIQPITNKKDSWCKEEVIEEKYELMNLFFTQHYSQLSNIGMTSQYIRQWVKENI